MPITSTIKLGLDSSAVKRGVESMKGRFKELGRSMKLAFAGVAAATVAYFQKFRHEMDRIQKLSIRLGVGTDVIQRLGEVAELAGADVEILVKGYQTLQKNVIAAENGAKSYQEALEDLGLSIEDVTGSAEHVYRNVIRAVERSEDKTRALAQAQVLMGRAGTEAGALLRSGVEEYDRALGRAVVTNDEVIQDMAALNDELTILSNTMRAKFGKAVVVVWKAFNVYLEKASERFAHVIVGVETLTEAITALANAQQKLLRPAELAGEIGGIIGGGFGRANAVTEDTNNRIGEIVRSPLENKARELEQRIQEQERRTNQASARGSDEFPQMLETLRKMEAQLEEIKDRGGSVLG